MTASSNGKTSNGTTTQPDFGTSLQIQSLQVDRGDIICLFTDGLSESIGVDRREFGLDRLARELKNNANNSVEDIRKRIVHELTRHREGNDISDDTTFVLLKKV